MGHSEPRRTVVYYILLLAVAVKPTSTTLTINAYDGTGIVKQQSLTMRCNYTKGGSDEITGFDWRHEEVVILSGSVTGQTAGFQAGTGWESGVFLGDFTSSLTIQLPVSSVKPSVAGQYTCRVVLNTGPNQDTAIATVHYSPKIESTFPTSQTLPEFNSLQIDCSSYTSLGNPQTTSYTWTYGGSTITSGAVLVINNITRDRRGQYTCTARNTVGSASETVSVDVQYAPHIESIFPSNRTVAESSRLQINCSSYVTQGNPSITSYTWTYGGSTSIPGAVLDLNNIGRDRRGQYTCTVSNTVGSDSETISVDVQYLDRPELLLNKTEVVENETVSLTCNVESNPTAEMAIRNVDNNTVLVERNTNRLQFTIKRLQCLHNGSFLCTAHNTQIGNTSYSALREIDVKCSPRQDFRQKQDSTVVKQINEMAALVANVIANPVPRFRWFRQESDGLTNISRDTIHSISNSRLQSVLYINISRTQDYGDYLLEMENSQGRNQLLFTLTSKVSTTTVTAYDGTGIVKQQPLTLGCNYTKGGSDVIDDFVWRHERDVILSGSVTGQIARFKPGTGWESGVFLGDFTSSLTIKLPASSVTPSVGGQYTCIMSSSVESVQDTATATVIYLNRPDLLLDKNEVIENETVSLTCNVESNPTAELAIKNVDNNTVLVERDTNRLQFTIDRVQCLHNGSFLCTAHNTQTGDLSTSVRKELIVLCSPRQDYRQALVQDVKCGLGDVAALAMHVIANPSPSFDWYVQKNQQLFPIPTSTEHSIVSSKQASVLQIQVENSRDYGMYAVTVENSIGRLQMTFTVSPVALPKPPNEVTVEDVTYNSLTISWRSNDNGCASQTFNIEFRMMKGEWRLWSEGIVDPGIGKTQKSEIRSLQPGTQYEVLVFARNPYGQSAKVVREVNTYDTAPAIQGLGVGIGISVMIPVIIVILSLWWLSKRRESKNRKRENIDSNELTLQQNSATGNQQNYTDMTMTESTVNEYEQLQVPPGQSKVYQNV